MQEDTNTRYLKADKDYMSGNINSVCELWICGMDYHLVSWKQRQSVHLKGN